jgi:hypothetical protein
MATAAPAIITNPTFTLADRLQIQRDRIRDRQYRKIGLLTTIVLERQLSTKGMSQSKPRFSSPDGAKYCPAGMEPFSAWQAAAWVNLTLEWLHHRNGSLLAISADRNDLLLPMGLSPLPQIPDPLWIPKKPGDVAPRIRQKLEDRAYGQIRERNGRLWLIFQPLTELCVAIGAGKDSGFGKIRCVTDPADHTHSALLVDPEPDRDGRMEAHFVGGSFQSGF